MPRKMLRRRLYTTKRILNQARKAMPWFLGSLIRGTLIAREMLERARIPSVIWVGGVR